MVSKNVDHGSVVYLYLQETLNQYELAEKFGVTQGSIGYIVRKYVPKDVRDKISYRRKIRPDSNGRIIDDHGYVLVRRPDWYQGRRRNRGDVREHQLVYCAAHGITKIPDGFVVHHKDHNKTNNSIGNLEMLSNSDHMKLHMSDKHTLHRSDK